ncbi:MAG: Holliday junction resolvase RuvX, partial [Nitriliruptoraceae bacterium]
GAAAQRARTVAAAVADRTDVAVVLWDERYTTVEAERSLIEADLSRTRRRQVIDQVAASVILQSVLDAQRRRRTADGSPATDNGDVNNSAAATDATEQEQPT